MKEKDDYLAQAKFFPIEHLQNETSKEWEVLLTDSDVDEQVKILATHFLIPFKISPLKFRFNLEYVDDFQLMELDSFWQGYDQVAPSLRLLYKNKMDIPLGYPKMFIISFPDVICWAKSVSGLMMIKKLLAEQYPSNYLTNNSLNGDVLKSIVQMYLGWTGKEKECEMLS